MNNEIDYRANLTFLINWTTGKKTDEVESELMRTAYQMPRSVRMNRQFGGGIALIEQTPADETGIKTRSIFLFNFMKSLQILNANKNNDPYIVAGAEFTDVVVKENTALIRIGWILIQDMSKNGIITI